MFKEQKRELKRAFRCCKMFRDSKSKVKEEDINRKSALHQVNLGVELRRGQRSRSKSG